MDIEILKAEFEASECFKRFERVVQYVTFDFGTYCAKVDIPKDAEKFVSGLIFSWKAWREAKAHEAEKLKGCVVAPESEYNEIAQYKDLYKRAIVNARKRKNQINWAHVSGLGVGSGRAVELCKELKIDPHATDMNVILEAARGGNE